MYIKQIIIEGFKSYRDRTVVESLDKGYNIVVGKNGTGKSNFFQAIQFVLSDEYSHMRPEQRQALLHEGTGPRNISAFVEIVIDNSDRRIAIDEDIIHLRRVIGVKKDEYLLNKNSTPRTEVMTLLETAGFSTSNSYYIVMQGKINQMATAPDSQRLKLLKEVAGCTTYDLCFNASMKVFHETAQKLDRNKEALLLIANKLKTLQDERVELKQYEQLDKKRRALEFVILEMEVSEYRKKLAEVSSRRNERGSEQYTTADQLEIYQIQIKERSLALVEIKKEIVSFKEERDSLNDNYDYLIKKGARLNLTIKDLETEIQDKLMEIAESKLTDLEKSIQDTKSDLEKVELNCIAVKQEKDEVSRELSLKQQKRKELYAKQGRKRQFTSREDRDHWIQNDLKALNKEIENKKEHYNRLLKDLENDVSKENELKEKIEKLSQEVVKYQSNIDMYNNTASKLKLKRQNSYINRSELWRKENFLQEKIISLKERLQKITPKPSSLSLSNGNNSMKKVLDTFLAKGDTEVLRCYHGLVIENFDCNNEYYTAIEAVARDQLFYNIVDTKEATTKMLKEFNLQKLSGTTNFMPLNCLNVTTNINYPKTDGAFSVISKLRYNPKYDSVMNQIFGRSLICKNIDVATKLARSSKFTCVTLEGDKVASSGVMSGGYINPSRSKLQMQAKCNELKEEVNQCETDLHTLKSDLQALESQIDTIEDELENCKSNIITAKTLSDKTMVDMRVCSEELETIKQSRSRKEENLKKCKFDLDSIEMKKVLLEMELRQEFLSDLSHAEKMEIESLTNDILKLQPIKKEVLRKSLELESEKNRLDNFLNNNLIKKRNEARQSNKVDLWKQKLAINENELKEIDKNIVQVKERISKVNKKISSLSNELRNHQDEMDKLNSSKMGKEDQLNESVKQLDSYERKQFLLEKKLQESLEKYSQLGTLSSTEFYNHYSKMNLKMLFKELERINSNLKKYSHVNKKALEQFLSFSGESEKLQKQQEILNKSQEKLKETFDITEQKKTEAIHFTFKQISMYFSEVFKKLVPEGQGRITMKSVDNKEGDEIDPDTTSDSFIGVGIKVSFTPQAEMRDMNQLSGGQKSLVALALIFAIQKCGSAPFYLFDEIDQALDKRHREAVATMMVEFSKKAQFITTTFRPELLQPAKMYYGVKFSNGVSHIEPISKEVAIDFFKND